MNITSTQTAPYPQFPSASKNESIQRLSYSEASIAERSREQQKSHRDVREDAKTLPSAEKRVVRAPRDVAGDERGWWPRGPGEAISQFSARTHGVHGTFWWFGGDGKGAK